MPIRFPQLPRIVEPYECCPWCGSEEFRRRNVFECDDCGRAFLYPVMAKDVRRVVEVKEDED